MNIFLETERLWLRQFTEEDDNYLFELDRDPEVMRFINGGYPTNYTTIQSQILSRFLAYYQKYQTYGVWAAIEKYSHEFIGWFHLFPAQENAFMVKLNLVNDQDIALGYRLRRSFWNQGYATEGSRLLVLQEFTARKNSTIVAWALVNNIASIRVMEKVGLKFEKEFLFAENQLPNLSDKERKAAIYTLHQENFRQEDNNMR